MSTNVYLHMTKALEEQFQDFARSKCIECDDYLANNTYLHCEKCYAKVKAEEERTELVPNHSE